MPFALNTTLGTNVLETVFYIKNDSAEKYYEDIVVQLMKEDSNLTGSTALTNGSLTTDGKLFSVNSYGRLATSLAFSYPALKIPQTLDGKYKHSYVPICEYSISSFNGTVSNLEGDYDISNTNVNPADVTTNPEMNVPGTQWTKTGAGTYSAGSWATSGAGSLSPTGLNIIPGKKYLVSFTVVSQVITGNIVLTLGGSATNYYQIPGNYTEVITAINSTALQFANSNISGGYFTGSINSISIKEAGQMFVGNSISGDGILPGSIVTAMGTQYGKFYFTLNKKPNKAQSNVAITINKKTDNDINVKFSYGYDQISDYDWSNLNPILVIPSVGNSTTPDTSYIPIRVRIEWINPPSIYTIRDYFLDVSYSTEGNVI
jgi:hypothetical protein